MIEEKFKIIVCGPKGSGKTTLCLKYLTKLFKSKLHATIGVDFFLGNMIFGDLDIKLRIWDFGGAERFEFLYSSYMKDADGALIIFDLKNEDNYLIIKKYINQIRENAGLDIPFIIIGNKLDLIEEDYRKKERTDVSNLAKKENTFYFETSAKTEYDLNECFNTLVQQIIKRQGLLKTAGISDKMIMQKLLKIKETTEDQVIFLFDLFEKAKILLKQCNFAQAKILIQNAKNFSINNGLEKGIIRADQLIKNLDEDFDKIRKNLQANKKKIHHLIYEEKLNRCPLHEEIDTHCMKIRSIKKLIEKPKIYGFFMYKFPSDNDHEYLLEIKKIKALIKILNRDPLIKIKLPSYSTDLDIKTCDFCKFARSFDFGLLLLNPANPNAFLEAGMFISLGKKVILLNNELRSKYAPFDLTPYFYIPYHNLEELEENWKRKLPKYVQNLKNFYLTAFNTLN